MDVRVRNELWAVLYCKYAVDSASSLYKVNRETCTIVRKWLQMLLLYGGSGGGGAGGIIFPGESVIYVGAFL